MAGSNKYLRRRKVALVHMYILYQYKIFYQFSSKETRLDYQPLFRKGAHARNQLVVKLPMAIGTLATTQYFYFFFVKDNF